MLLIGAMVIAIGTALAARSMLSGGNAAPVVQAALPVAPTGPKVLVAQRALPPGTIITADAVNFQDWPGNLMKEAYFVDGKIDMNKLIGTVVRYPITAGQPLTQGALVAPGDRGFLAAALGAGMRAITITVSEKSGVAGFIFPGDRVDIMLTQTIRGNGGDAQSLNVTETVLRNLRVLATDQSTENQTNEGKTVVRTFHTVTLEVTPKIAEKIEVAQAVGALSLTLRSLADNQGDLDRAIANGAVKLPEGASKADENRLLAAASRPSAFGGSGGESMTTGAEVSRFQKRTLPPSGPVMAAAGGAPSMGAPVVARASSNGVRVIRGRDTQTVSMGANGQPVQAIANGMGAAGNAFGGGAAAPLAQP